MWFIVPYKRMPNVIRGGSVRARRYCAMDDYTALIHADGGDWAEQEILGDSAVVAVKASAQTLATIASDPTFTALPDKALDLTLSDLTNKQVNDLVGKLRSLGYSIPELAAKLPDVKSATLRQVLKVAATRRIKPRYDAQTDTIVFDSDVIEIVPDAKTGKHPIDLIDETINKSASRG